MQHSPSPPSAAPLAATRATPTDLDAIARGLGVRVAVADLGPGLLGLYDARSHRIWLAPGLTPVERRCVLAHELGHAHHRHRSGSPANERVADAFAARLLVDPAALEAASRWSHDPAEIADELDLTEDVVRAYLTLVAGAAR
jgi:hypothetical protein